MSRNRFLLAALLCLSLFFALANFTGVGVDRGVGAEPWDSSALARSFRDPLREVSAVFSGREDVPVSAAGDVMLQAGTSVSRDSKALEKPAVLIKDAALAPHRSSAAVSFLSGLLTSVSRFRLSAPGAPAPLHDAPEPAGALAGSMPHLARIRASAWYLLGYLIFVFLSAVLYRTFRKHVVRAPRDPDFVRRMEGGFDADILDCTGCFGEDRLLCLCSFCCLGLRWAESFDTDHSGGIGFWGALFLSTACLAFTGILFDSVGIGCYLVFVLVAVLSRQRLRKAAGLEAGSAQTLVEDCVVWSCLCCCAGAQEARQVDHYMAKS